jgi:nucleotide-binding universal stress UspA family protein
MIKRILVPLDASPFADAAVDFGCSIAKQHGAQVSGLVVLDVPGIEKSVGPVPAGGFYYAERIVAENESRTRARVDMLLERFRDKCRREGVAHVEAERQGVPSKNILEESVYYDCVIMGLRTYFDFETDAGEDQQYGTEDDRAGRSLERVMGHAAIPIVALPMNWKLPQRKLRSLVALETSLPSARALHAFAQIFSPASTDVTLLTASEDRAEAQSRLEQAAAYLRTYDFSVAGKVWRSSDLRGVIGGPEFAAADLVVLGAHSETALVEFVVGSACRDLINRAEKPLLIGN